MSWYKITADAAATNAIFNMNTSNMRVAVKNTVGKLNMIRSRAYLCMNLDASFIIGFL